MKTNNQLAIDRQAELVNKLQDDLLSLQQTYDEYNRDGRNMTQIVHEIQVAQEALDDAQWVYKGLVDQEFR